VNDVHPPTYIPPKAIVSGKEVNRPLRINQDASLYVSEVDKVKQLMVEMVKNKH
jgi:hypothetical protein